MIVLDTNVVSELMRDAPSGSVLAWADAQVPSDLAITSLTAAELRAGVAMLPRGRRRTAIEERVDGLLEETFAGSVLPFDAGSAVFFGEVVAARRRAGTPIATVDAQIASVCLQHDGVLATRNRRDFEGLRLELVDPWAA